MARTRVAFWPLPPFVRFPLYEELKYLNSPLKNLSICTFLEPVHTAGGPVIIPARRRTDLVCSWMRGRRCHVYLTLSPSKLGLACIRAIVQTSLNPICGNNCGNLKRTFESTTIRSHLFTPDIDIISRNLDLHIVIF